MCGGGGGSTPKADPVAEREKAQEEATQKANMELLTAARRRRLGRGLLVSGAQIGTKKVASVTSKPAFQIPPSPVGPNESSAG